jgi:hypothetical protein
MAFPEAQGRHRSGSNWQVGSGPSNVRFGKSRHSLMSEQCPLYPRKRTLLRVIGMSALCQKQTHALQHKTSLIDHLVGAGEPRGRNSNSTPRRRIR